MQRSLLWFGWRGRLRRRSFAWMTGLASVIFVVLFLSIERIVGYGATLVLYPIFFAALASLSVRRLHDQARNALWLLILLLPVLGPTLLALVLLFRRGTPGENQYGDDPTLIGRDYLTVAIHEPT